MNTNKPINIPKIDVSSLKSNLSVLPTYSIVQNINREMNESISKALELNQHEIIRKEEARQATIQTAENTKEMKSTLQDVVHNQNDYILLLKTIIENQKKQIEQQEEQIESAKITLDALLGILNYSELSTDVQNEISEMVRNEITNKHPVFDFMADKGGDVATNWICSQLPHVFNALKAFIMLKGII